MGFASGYPNEILHQAATSYIFTYFKPEQFWYLQVSLYQSLVC